MAFDPDAALAELKAPKAFDPDAALSELKSASFDPDKALAELQDPMEVKKRRAQEIQQKVAEGGLLTPGEKEEFQSHQYEIGLDAIKKQGYGESRLGGAKAKLERMGQGLSAVASDIGNTVAAVPEALATVATLDPQKYAEFNEKYKDLGISKMAGGMKEIAEKAITHQNPGESTEDYRRRRDRAALGFVGGLGTGAFVNMPMMAGGALDSVADVFRTPEEQAQEDARWKALNLEVEAGKNKLFGDAKAAAVAGEQVGPLLVSIGSASVPAKAVEKMTQGAMNVGKMAAGGAGQVAAKVAGSPITRVVTAASTGGLEGVVGALLAETTPAIRSSYGFLVKEIPKYADDLSRVVRQAGQEGLRVGDALAQKLPQRITQLEKELADLSNPMKNAPDGYTRMQVRALNDRLRVYRALADNSPIASKILNGLEGEISSAVTAAGRVGLAGAEGAAFGAPLAQIGEPEELTSGAAFMWPIALAGSGFKGRSVRGTVQAERFQKAGEAKAASASSWDSPEEHAAAQNMDSQMASTPQGAEILKAVNVARGALPSKKIRILSDAEWQATGGADHPARVDADGNIEVNGAYRDVASLEQFLNHEVGHTAEGLILQHAPEMYNQFRERVAKALGSTNIQKFDDGYLYALLKPKIFGGKSFSELSPVERQGWSDAVKELRANPGRLEDFVPPDALSELAAEHAKEFLNGKSLGDVALPKEFGDYLRQGLRSFFDRWGLRQEGGQLQYTAKGDDINVDNQSMNLMGEIVRKAIELEQSGTRKPVETTSTENPLGTPEPVAERMPPQYPPEVTDARIRAVNALRAGGYEDDARFLEDLNNSAGTLHDRWFDIPKSGRSARQNAAWDAIQKATALEDNAVSLGQMEKPGTNAQPKRTATPVSGDEAASVTSKTPEERGAAAEVDAQTAVQVQPAKAPVIRQIVDAIKQSAAMTINYLGAPGMEGATNIERVVSQRQNKPGSRLRAEGGEVHPETFIPMKTRLSNDGNMLVSGYSMDKTVLRNAKLFFDRVNTSRLGFEIPFKDIAEVGRALDRYFEQHSSGYDAAGNPIPHRAQLTDAPPHQFTPIERQFMNLLMGIEAKDAAGLDVNPLRSLLNETGAAGMHTKDLFHPVWETLRVDHIEDVLGTEQAHTPDYPSIKRGYAPAPEKPLAAARLTQDMGDQARFLEDASVRRFGKPLQDVVLDPDQTKFQALAQEWRDANSRFSKEGIQQYAPAPETEREFNKRLKGYVEKGDSSVIKPTAFKNDKGELVRDKKGKFKVQPISYDLLGAPGLKELRGTEAERAAINNKNVQKGADKLVSYFETVKNEPDVMAAMGWYAKMREAFREAFGANAEMMSQLLGATSANTGVAENFKYTMDLLRKHAKGDFNDILERYENHRAETQRKLADGTLEKEWVPTKTEKKFDPETAVYREDQKFINAPENVLRQDNGSQFGMNSKPALKALHGSWLEDVGAPKTPNFAGNLSGRTVEATIDVWAARNLRRLLYGDKARTRIHPQSEQGVTDPDFRFAQEIYRRAADKIGMNPDDLQAVMWFAEKKHWAQNGWTGATGEALSSFEPFMQALGVDRYKVGMTPFTNRETFTESTWPAYLAGIEQMRAAIGKNPDILAARVTPSEGVYGGKEPSYDIEFTVRKGADVSSIIDHVGRIVNGELTPGNPELTRQSDVLISKMVGPDHPNARPMLEVAFKRPLNEAQLAEFEKDFSSFRGPTGQSFDGYTISRDSQGRAIGIWTQFVPEFKASFGETPQERASFLDPDSVAQHIENFKDLVQDAVDNLRNNDSVADARLSWADSTVAGKGEYEKLKEIFRSNQGTGSGEPAANREAGGGAGSQLQSSLNRRRELLISQGKDVAAIPGKSGGSLSDNPSAIPGKPLADVKIGGGSTGSNPGGNVEGLGNAGGNEAPGVSGGRQYAAAPLADVQIKKNDKIARLARVVLGTKLEKEGYSVPAEGKFSPNRVVPPGEESVLSLADSEMAMDLAIPKDEFAAVKSSAPKSEKPYYDALEQLRKVFKPIPAAAEKYIEQTIQNGTALGEGSEAYVLQYPGDKSQVLKVFKTPLTQARVAVKPAADALSNPTVSLIAADAGIVENLNRINRYNALPDVAPIEILGFNQEGQVVARQPAMLQDAQPGARDAYIDQQVRNGNAVVMNTRQPAALAMGIGRELIPEGWENQPFLKDANGNWYSMMDVRDGNFMEGYDGKVYLTDALPHPISNADIDRIPEPARSAFEQFRPKNMEKYNYAPEADIKEKKKSISFERPLQNVKFAQPGDEKKRRRTPLAVSP